MTPPLLAELRAAFAREGDPQRAEGAQAYMKTTIPFYGVPMPRMRAICKQLFARHPFPDAAAWRRDVLALFRGATHREEMYAAIELAEDRRARGFLDMDALPMLESMIVGGAWWDLVDPIATHLLPCILAREPAPMRKAMLAWSRCDDVWKRRSAILCQIKRRDALEPDLFYACLEPSIERKEFWLRKAIGWALRERARTDADEVVRWVDAHRDRLSGLSVREALKHVAAAPTSSPARGAPRRSAGGARRTPARARRA